MCNANLVLILELLFPIDYSVHTLNYVLLLESGTLVLLAVTCINSLIANQVAGLYPPEVRFVGTRISMNLSDGILGVVQLYLYILLRNLAKNRYA